MRPLSLNKFEDILCMHERSNDKVIKWTFDEMQLFMNAYIYKIHKHWKPITRKREKIKLKSKSKCVYPNWKSVIILLPVVAVIYYHHSSRQSDKSQFVHNNQQRISKCCWFQNLKWIVMRVCVYLNKHIYIIYTIDPCYVLHNVVSVVRRIIAIWTHIV